MSLALEPIVAAALSKEAATLVFPSQLAADAWAVAALLRFGAGAVDPDRFFGWDRFKETRFSRHVEEAPANRVTRTMWAAGIVARQERRPFLRRMLGPGAPSPSFVGYLAKIPPSLAAIARTLRGKGVEGKLHEDETMLDLLDLHDDYRRFLERKGLFEPSWEPLPLEEGDGEFVLLCPELIEDYEEYRWALEASKSITIIRMPEPPAPPALRRFENLHEELRWVFLRVARLLDEGAAPEDIGVTVADLDEARPWVEAAARAAGVPYVIRRGKPLSSSPFGRFLREAGEAASSGFGLPEMEALLLDRFVAWKEAERAGRLVRFGFDYHVFASFSKEGKRVDIWDESFRVTGADRDLVSFYRRLRKAALDLEGARSFAALKAAIVTIRMQFLDETGLRDDERRIIERSMEELETLVRAETAYGGEEDLPSPFALFLACLDEERYVPQEAGGRVQVFPLRVSALLPFETHFLVGCGQDAVAVTYAAEGFLREDQKAALGRVSRDATGDFLAAYLHSGATLIPCHADTGIAGWSAPHPFFPDPDPARGTPVETDLAAQDLLGGERRAWAGAAPLPSRLLPLQVRSYARSLVVGRSLGRDFSVIIGTALDRVVARASREDGFLRLSSTLLDEYRSCPFRWLVRRDLAVGEAEYGLDFFDARLAGEMAHRAIEHFFEGIGRLGPLSADHRDEYRRLAAEAPRAILPGFAASKGPFLIPMFEAWLPLLEDRLERLADAVSREPGWEVGELEIRLEKPMPEVGAVLEGRIDRLAKRGEERAIVDYKKKALPRAVDLVVGAGSAGGVDEEGEVEEVESEEGLPEPRAEAELGDTQIASYIALAEGAGLRISRASYWSIEMAKELLVVGEGGLRAREDYEGELLALGRAVETVAGGIRQGLFNYALPSSPACTACTAKGLCRSHFAAD